MAAAQCGNRETTQALLQSGVDLSINPAIKGTIPAISHAASERNPEIIYLLCRYGADINIVSAVHGLLAEQLATTFSEATCVQVLITKGVGLDIMFAEVHPILDLAVMLGSIDIMKIITKAGIHGITLNLTDIERLWGSFDTRDLSYDAPRASVEEERAVFQELWDSVML